MTLVIQLTREKGYISHKNWSFILQTFAKLPTEKNDPILSPIRVYWQKYKNDHV
jgi:hypothetical protein